MRTSPIASACWPHLAPWSYIHEQRGEDTPPKLDAAYTKDKPDAKHYKLLIDGEWVDRSTGEEIAVYSPVDGELLGYYPEASKDDVDRAVAAARRAAAEWRLRPPFERVAIVHQMAEALGRHREDPAPLKSRENGKPYAAEAIPCAEESSENFRIAAEDIKRLESPVIPSRDSPRTYITCPPWSMTCRETR